MYDEEYRPQFHFTYKRGWTSDVNGPVWYQGTYHLFTQHNPAGPDLDYLNIHWGHAVSTDLVHWKELPPALAPDQDGPVFSGSSVVDWHDTAGFQGTGLPPIVAFYTAARYMLPAARDGVQSIAYSIDGGRTFSKYAGNPVLQALTHYNRDPKVFWHEQTGRWVMAITLSCANHWLDGDYRFALFSSPDLKSWSEMSRFEMPRGLDCCDMFELPVDGDPQERRWVFWAGDCTHMIGTFDGRSFHREGEIQLPLLSWEENGSNGYAAQTFSEMPPGDGRRVQIAWLRHGRYPGMPFNQQNLIPCELTLRRTREGIRLFREPVREIDVLHGRSWEWGGRGLRSGEDLLAGIPGELFDIRAEIDPRRASAVAFRVRGATLRYDPASGTVSCLGKTVSAGSEDGRLRLRLLADRTTLEVFADRGRTSLSFYLPPSRDRAPLGLAVDGGEAALDSLAISEMRSIWRG